MGRTATAVGAVACALAPAACGGTGGGTGTTRADVGVPAAAVGAPMPQQTANGPVQPRAAGARPLLLRRTAERVRVRFPHPPRGGLLFDLDSGAVLWERLPTRRLPIASLTKLMTAILVADGAAPSARVRISRAAVDAPGSKVGLLPLGRRVRVETLLYGLLLPSGNDAAVALAQGVAGSVPRFVERMNARARDMGLACTRFASPSGIVDRGNHSCAADLAQLARATLDEPRLARIVRRRQAALPFPIKGGRLYLSNHNPLLRMGYPGTIGLKTGYTDAAGRCLVAAVRRHGRRLGVVLLHSPDPARQARRLLDRALRSTRRP